MNLASLSIDFFARDFDLVRKAAGEYDTAGDWIADGLDQKTKARGVMQPMTGEVLKSLEEGLREFATHVFWCKEQVKLDDLIISKGTRYRVLKARDWQELGGYYRAVVERLED